jgi:hypothetical protein
MRRIVGSLLLLLGSVSGAGAVGTLSCVPVASGILAQLGAASYINVTQCTTSAAYTAGGDQFAQVGRDLCGSANRLVKFVLVEGVKANGATTAVNFDYIPSTQKLQCFVTGAALSGPFAECTTQGQGLVVNLLAFCA